MNNDKLVQDTRAFLDALTARFLANGSIEVLFGMAIARFNEFFQEYNRMAAELAEAKAKLADALANDASDAETIRLAQEEAQAAQDRADAAQAKANELQALADADAAEDAQINAAIDSVLPPVQ